MENLLENPSFTEGWTRDTLDGVERGNVFTPTGWISHAVEGDENNHAGVPTLWPEVHVINAQIPYLDPPRTRSGGHAVKVHKDFDPMLYYLMQEVELEAGKSYKFGGHAHAWSQHPGIEPDDDAHCSSGAGCGAQRWEEGAVPPLDGTPENDAIGNSTVRVGYIEGPPSSAGIVTSPGACIYNAFDEVPPVQFVAPSGGVATVVVELSTQWRFRVADFYLDDFWLVRIDSGDCWGQPREQYARRYNVVSSYDEAHKVLDILEAAGKDLQTVGPSSDDAGMGMVEDKTAIEWNRPLVQHEAYRNFYDDNYPVADVEFDSTEPAGITLYSQRDSRWRNYVYGGGKTLGQTGCLITCVAMLTGDTPPVTAQKLKDAGALDGAYLSRPQLVTNAYPNLPYGGTIHWRSTAADLDKLADWLGDGPVVVETEFSPGGAVPPADQHFVVGLEIDGGDLVIADPWTGERTRLLARYALSNWSLSRAVYGARLFGHEPGSPPQPPAYGNLLGVHQQREANGVPEYYLRSEPSVYKTVLNFQGCRPIKGWSGNTVTVIRPFPNNVTGKDAVQSIVAGIADDLAALHPWIDYVELINEQVPSGNDGAIIEAVDTEIWGMEKLKELGYPVLPLILNVAPGNPWGPWDADRWHDQQPLLVRAVQASVDLFGEACCGYHGYWPSNREAAYLRFANVNGVRTDVGRYYSFRWQEWDKEFARHGLKPKYILSEMGPIGTHGPRQDGYIDMMPHDGWKSSDCIGGSRTRLIDEFALWQAEGAAWNATHQNRLLGGTVFTTGGGSKWSSFEFGEAEMRAWSMRLEDE